MTYCDLYDVQAELPHFTFTGSSVPTIEDVESYCDQVGDEMDSLFAAVGVALPILDDGPLSVALQIATLGVCARVLRAAELQDDRAKWYQDMYDRKLATIRALPSMLSPSEEVIPSAPSGYDSGLEAEDRHFHREDQDW